MDFGYGVQGMGDLIGGVTVVPLSEPQSAVVVLIQGEGVEKLDDRTLLNTATDELVQVAIARSAPDYLGLRYFSEGIANYFVREALGEDYVEPDDVLYLEWTEVFGAVVNLVGESTEVQGQEDAKDLARKAFLEGDVESLGRFERYAQQAISDRWGSQTVGLETLKALARDSSLDGMIAAQVALSIVDRK